MIGRFEMIILREYLWQSHVVDTCKYHMFLLLLNCMRMNLKENKTSFPGIGTIQSCKFRSFIIFSVSEYIYGVKQNFQKNYSVSETF